MEIQKLSLGRYGRLKEPLTKSRNFIEQSKSILGFFNEIEHHQAAKFSYIRIHAYTGKHHVELKCN